MSVNEEHAEAARILAKLEPGFLPFEIFQQVARLSVLAIVEIVPLRIAADGEVEVLLLQRAADDPLFSGQLHTPGCVVRATDAHGSFETAFQRLMQDELGGVRATEPVFVAQLLHHSGRGTESAHVYWVEIQDEPITGSFYRASELPDNFMPSQLDFVPQAVSAYRAAVAQPLEDFELH